MSGDNWRAVKRDTGWAVWKKLSELGDQQIANGLSEREAKLIAAAPALLEACKMVLEVGLADENGAGQVQDAVYAAIALAEQEG